METIEIIKTLLDLGLTAILLYFLFIVWEDRKQTIKNKDDKLAEKDAQIKGMHEAVLEVVKDNTKANTELRGAIDANTKAIDANTRSSDTLTARVYDALKGK